MIHTVKGFSVGNEADDFLEFPCFYYGPTDVGKLFSGFSAFSKSSLYIRKFLVHILLKPSLKDFEPCEHVKWVQLWSNLNILWHCPSLGSEWKLNFSSPVATAEFSKFVGILSAAISQHHLLGFEIAQLEFHHLIAVFTVILLKAHLTSHSGCLALDKWSHHVHYLGHEDLFCTVLLCIFATSSKYLLLLSGPYHFCPFIVPIFVWNVPLAALIFLKSSLVFPIFFFLYFFALIT